MQTSGANALVTKARESGNLLEASEAKNKLEQEAENVERDQPCL